VGDPEFEPDSETAACAPRGPPRTPAPIPACSPTSTSTSRHWRSDTVSVAAGRSLGAFLGRHRLGADEYRREMTVRFAIWN
jgi:hypothetical protein